MKVFYEKLSKFIEDELIIGTDRQRKYYDATNETSREDFGYWTGYVGALERIRDRLKFIIQTEMENLHSKETK